MVDSECLSVFPIHSKRVWQLASHPSCKSVASCSADGTIQITNIDTGKSFSLGEVSKKSIRSISYSHDGRLFAACGFDGTTKIWNTSSTSYSLICTLEGHENEVKCVDWAPASLISSTTYLLATCGRDKSIWLWAIEIDSFSSSSQEVLAILQEHSQDVKCIAFHPEYPGIMASASADESIRIWVDCDSDIIGRGDGDWISKALLTGHTGIVWQVAWLTSSLLLSVSEDGTAKMWGPSSSSLLSSSWNCLQEIRISSRPCYSLSSKFDFQDQRLVVAIGTGENSIALFSISMENPKLELNPMGIISSAHTQDVNSVMWITPDSLLSASDDTLVKLWRIVN